jgi:glucose/arabinose dehydrogenase
LIEGYIPYGMLQKQYRWEWVNYQLYCYLYRMDVGPDLQEVISELIRKQEGQLTLLQRMLHFQGILLETLPLRIEYDQDVLKLIKELYDREYQLLQEYLSYSVYFLPGPTQSQLGVHELIQEQMAQVNTLLQLKQTNSKLMSSNKSTSQEHQHRDSIKTDQPNIPEYVLEEGYRLEKVAAPFTFPTDITFDDEGNVYVAEAGFAYGTQPREGRIVRVERDGSLTPIAGGFEGPVTSIRWHRGYFYVAEGARGGNPGVGCGQITKVSMDGGERKIIVSGLKTCGDHFTGEIEFGPDGKLYFTVGTATNSAVVGTDNKAWLKLHPQFSDTPARDYVLNGQNFVSPNPLTDEKDAAVTGAYKPFGIPSYDGEIIQGHLLANGVLYCCEPDGSQLTLVADGFRNPFGLKFSPFNGKLYLTDNGADPRGNRPIQHDWDHFWEVIPQGWYGWPDFFSGLPATLPHFHVEDEPKPTFLLKRHPYLATQPITRFTHHSASHKFDFSTNPVFGHVGEVFVAQLGDMDWGHHEENFGFKVVRFNMETGQIRNFLVNPTAEKNLVGPIRPVAAKFNPEGRELYVVDFGILGSPPQNKEPIPGTGTLWRIVRMMSG